ncbi:MAG: hypothetical protein KAX13_06315 [Candidatus Krumholzibacteria bacterium]|nr:hypothetical protein [Candidatus Krumholzibacteria bacterium]
MRKVLVVLTSLVLSAFLFSCSEDDTTVTPDPTPEDLVIVTATVPAGLTCTPYRVTLEATGGVTPYTWALATGSVLPDCLNLSADGELIGIIEDPGDFLFTIECTDNAGTPVTVDQAYDLNIDVPANPSLAIFFDESASLCSGVADQDFMGIGTYVDCYAFIMLEGGDIGCTRGCEFMVIVKDADGNELEHGTDFVYINFSTPADMMYVGSLESGIGIVKSGGAPLYGPNPIRVAMFSLLLLEEFENLSFEIVPNPGAVYPTARPTVATCDDGYPLVEVDGRNAAVNWQ